MTNRADLKADMARAAHSAIGQVPMLVDRPEDMPGWSLYRVGQVIVGTPTLLPTAPKSVKRRHLARIITNATGTCPSCRATVGERSHSMRLARSPTSCPNARHRLRICAVPAASSLRTFLASVSRLESTMRGRSGARTSSWSVRIWSRVTPRIRSLVSGSLVSNWSMPAS